MQFCVQPVQTVCMSHDRFLLLAGGVLFRYSIHNRIQFFNSELCQNALINQKHAGVRACMGFARAWQRRAAGTCFRDAGLKKEHAWPYKEPLRTRMDMLSLQYRLKAKEDFNRIYREGGVRNCAWMGMRYCRNGKKGTRVGFVIPNSVIKHATGRNRLRRQLRAAVQKNFFSLPAGFDIFFVVKRYLSPLPFIVIEHDLLLLVYHLSMLKQNT